MSDHFDIGSSGLLSKPMLDEMLLWAEGMGYSDIYLMSGSPVHGKLHKEVNPITKTPLRGSGFSELIEYLYHETGTAVIQDKGYIDTNYSIIDDYDKEYRFRVSVTAVEAPSGIAQGYQIVLRVVDSDIQSTESLGLTPTMVHPFKSGVGIGLVTGKTNSGKTTTCASILKEIIQSMRVHIITFESPIETSFHHVENKKALVVQSESPRDIKEYDDAVGNSLRRSPDYVYFSELRTKNIINAAITEASTGHFVVGTLHTNTLANTFARVAAEYPDDSRKAVIMKFLSVVSVIIHQELYPKVGGGLIAIRECLTFTIKIKEILAERLLQSPTGDIEADIDELVSSRGESFVANAKKAFDKGLIDGETYQLICFQRGVINPHLEAMGG